MTYCISITIIFVLSVLQMLTGLVSKLIEDHYMLLCFVGGNLVAWRSKKQSVASQSSTEYVQSYITIYV